MRIIIASIRWLIPMLFMSLAALSARAESVGRLAPEAQALFWNSDSISAVSQLKGGKLILTPQDGPWTYATAISRRSHYLWTQDGMTLQMRVAPRTLVQGDSRDFSLAIGLVPSDNIRCVQDSNSFVGLWINVSGKTGTITPGLARKEKYGSSEKIRGDKYGNVISYSGTQTAIKAPDGALDSTFKITRDTVSASIAGTGYAQQFPVDLSQELWRRAFVVVQCNNVSDGRGSVTIEDVTVTSPHLTTPHVEFLDLRPFANMGFTDEVAGDKQGGWTDQGNNDLRYLTTGPQVLRTLPFDIMNPDTNHGKSCIMLYSSNRDYFPKAVGPVKIGKTADSLLFLHAAAWGKDAGPAAKYRVEYTDGTQVDIPMNIDEQLPDFWELRPPSDPQAALLMRLQSDRSRSGVIGLYGYRWKNPNPAKEIASLSFISAERAPVVGILAVTLVRPSIGADEENLLKVAFERVQEVDFRKNPPDQNSVADHPVLRTAKRIGSTGFSTNGNYNGGDAGQAMFEQAGYLKALQACGPLTRFPYGFDSSFSFWPYQVSDWDPVLGAKGGSYGTIPRWFYKNVKRNQILSYQTALSECKKRDLKMILVFNTHSMFDGKDFVYIKTLPEEKMKRQNPMEQGAFSQANLDAIVKNNATLVDYIVKNGYTDTVSLWEMDNERWDMPGKEYAQAVAAHVNMLREKLPNAKVIVCLGEIDSYSPNPGATACVIWSKDMLAELKRLGMTDKIDYFAPHIYPFLKDKASEITQNYLEDFGVRNVNRSLDYMSALVDSYGFQRSKFYLTEWGTQSDPLLVNHNELITSMAAGLATAKTMMAIYAHPRVEGATWHQMIHRSFVSKASNKSISQWGNQAVFFTDDGRYIMTPPAQAVAMFKAFATESTLTPQTLSVPAGVHYLHATDAAGDKYFVVNSTANPVIFPVPGIKERRSLFTDKVTSNSIIKYGSYDEKPGEVDEIITRDFSDAVLPPYSINVLR